MLLVTNKLSLDLLTLLITFGTTGGAINRKMAFERRVRVCACWLNSHSRHYRCNCALQSPSLNHADEGDKQSCSVVLVFVAIIKCSELSSEIEMCMKMGINGISWVPWDSHANGNGNVDGNKNGIEMGINVMGMRLAFSQWHFHNHHFISNSRFLCTWGKHSSFFIL